MSRIESRAAIERLNLKQGLNSLPTGTKPFHQLPKRDKDDLIVLQSVPSTKDDVVVPYSALEPVCDANQEKVSSSLPTRNER
ncbi:hypothetical protein FoTM2_017823 [Fusarium oxysporum f. sp. vasinfectum]|nr:hypothetical protein FoTM2_017683 [Fusarium oxysporum f. sp. vasinfectum]KAK2922467.1 hypothetical protein FoTM2_017823 [Fusarium oxysporum f. sp. vasinfectum]